jgi:hypothetical protein
MTPNLFPLGCFSKPLAAKIGLEPAVVLYELIKDHKEGRFTWDDNYIKNLGCQSSVWSKDQLIRYDLLLELEGVFYINYDKLDLLLQSTSTIKTNQVSKELLLHCQKWIRFLKEKKGVDKGIALFLNEMKGKDELEIISAINNSINNNWKTLFFKDQSKSFEKKPRERWGAL